MKRGKVVCAGLCGLNVEVDAWLHGDWAVHRGPSPESWRVTHAPSGIRLVDTGCLQNAQTAARMLDQIGAGRGLPSLTVDPVDDTDWLSGMLLEEWELNALLAATDIARGAS